MEKSGLKKARLGVEPSLYESCQDRDYLALSNPVMGLRRQPSVKSLICGKPEENLQGIISYKYDKG